MLKFTRNKLVTIQQENADTLIVHGVLEDDIYGLELNAQIRISDMTFLSIIGKWNRFTTAECPLALPFLQEIVGFKIEEGIDRKLQKTIGRKGCRHFATLLIECCSAVYEALKIMRLEAAEAKISKIEMPEKKKEFKPFEKQRSGGIVVDLHTHSFPASKCSTVSEDLLIETAKQIGLDGICLTDHNYIWEPERIENLRQKHGFLILRGNEVTTDQGHVLVFGMDKIIATKEIIKLEELRQEVINAGGFIILAHPFRGFLVFNVGQLGLTVEKAIERPLFKMVDAIEVMNGKVTADENAFAAKVAQALGYPATGGSDAHEIAEVGCYATRFFDPIKNESDLVNALKSGNYAPLSFRFAKNAVS